MFTQDSTTILKNCLLMKKSIIEVAMCSSIPMVDLVYQNICVCLSFSNYISLCPLNMLKYLPVCSFTVFLASFCISLKKQYSQIPTFSSMYYLLFLSSHLQYEETFYRCNMSMHTSPYTLMHQYKCEHACVNCKYVYIHAAFM